MCFGVVSYRDVGMRISLLWEGLLLMKQLQPMQRVPQKWVQCLLCTCGRYLMATAVFVCRVNKNTAFYSSVFTVMEMFPKALKDASGVCNDQLWLCWWVKGSWNIHGHSFMLDFHSRISQNNMCCVCSNMITALSPYISIRPEPPPLIAPGTYISNSVRPEEKTLETRMLRGQVGGWLSAGDSSVESCWKDF